MAARHRDPTWPYEDVEEASERPASDPTWECPVAFCRCHPGTPTKKPPAKFTVLLCDERAARMPGARCRVLAGGVLLNEDQPYADGAGRITLEARRLPEMVLVEWAPADTPLDERYPFRKTHYVAPGREDRDEAARRRLHNLDFRYGLTVEDDIRDFQRAHGLLPTGRLDDVEARLVAQNDGMLVGAGRNSAVTGPAGARAYETASFADAGAGDAGGAGEQEGGGNGGALVAKDDTGFELRVVAANPLHRFVRDLRGTMTLPGKDTDVTVPPKVQRPGLILFRVQGGTARVRLALTIPKPGTGKGPVTGEDAILHVEQTFTVGEVDGKPTLVAETSNVGTAHPRIRVTRQPTYVEVWLDTRFLDVTRHVKALPKKTTFSDFLDIESLLCSYRVLEHTGGSPEGWVIVIPPAVDRDQASLNLLLFLQHEYKLQYRTPDDIDYRRLGLYFAPSPRPGCFVYPDGDAWFHRYPNCGWDAQLEKSTRPVIVAFPFPHGDGFGVAHSPDRAKALLDGLLVCLGAERHVARSAGKPTLGRLAVGGWSSGVTPAINWCSPQVPLVDEGFLFDGQSAAARRIAGLETWFKAKEGRKLHLVGTAYTENEMNALARSIGSTNAVVRPGNPMNWYPTDRTPGDVVYQRALSLPSDTGTAERFRELGTPLATPPADATDFTGIFFVKGNVNLHPEGTFVQDMSMTLTWVRDGKPQRERVARFISLVEAASLLRFSIWKNNPKVPPVRDQGTFDRAVGFLNQTGDKSEPQQGAAMRHPWAIVGGQARPDPEDTSKLAFVGFFQLALEDSGFA